MSSYPASVEGNPITIPTGSFWIEHLKGRDRQIDSQEGSSLRFGLGAVTGPYCNYRVDFLYLDENDRLYQVNRGPVINECQQQPERV